MIHMVAAKAGWVKYWNVFSTGWCIDAPRVAGEALSPSQQRGSPPRPSHNLASVELTFERVLVIYDWSVPMHYMLLRISNLCPDMTIDFATVLRKWEVVPTVIYISIVNRMDIDTKYDISTITYFSYNNSSWVLVTSQVLFNDVHYII